jgi:hypothetical protein
MLNTTGKVRGRFTGCIRAIGSPRPSVMSKNNVSPVGFALSVMSEDHATVSRAVLAKYMASRPLLAGRLCIPADGEVFDCTPARRGR